MLKTGSSDSLLSLTPLGAGDLIDRSVRVYRQNFVTFFLIAAPPVLTATIFSVLWTFFIRWMFPMGIGADELSYTVYALLSALGGLMVMTLEFMAMLTIMGGASRNFVRNLLFGEPISFKETYRNVKNRLASLLVASFLITIIVGAVSMFILYFWLIVVFLGLGLFAVGFENSPTTLAILTVVFSIVTFTGAATLYFLVISRLVYIPQAMLVENKGVAASFGRSITLAKGNVKRVAALIIFSILVTYSAIAILYVPLIWISVIEGIDMFGYQAAVPAWYEIATQLIGQISIILLAPVWMAGLCLLYVDERVRHEGYDIELMAAKRLGEIPNVPKEYLNPLQPALAAESVNPTKPENERSDLTMISLK